MTEPGSAGGDRRSQALVRTAGVIVAAAFIAVACGYSDPYTTSGPVAGESPAPPSPSPGQDDCNAGAGIKPVTYPDGLQIIDYVVGTGAVAHSGDKVEMQYTGWLLECGTPFDSSRTRGQAFPVTLGQHQVIPGWEEGIPGMKVGGKRKLIIPPALAYGARGQPPTIPANSTLVFDVELVTDTPGPSPSPSPTPSPSPSPTK